MSKLTPKIVVGDWNSVAHAIAKLDQSLNSGAAPTFLGLTLKGGLDMTGNPITDLGYIDFDITASPGDGPEGRMKWNANEHTADLTTGLGPVLQIGQESFVLVYNGTGSTIYNGTAVHPVGAVGGRPSVAVAAADTHVTFRGVVLVTTMDIPDGTVGVVSQDGKVRGVDTSGFDLGTYGNVIWLANDGEGILNNVTNIRPSFPSYAVQLGGIAVQDAADGVLQLEIVGKATDTTQNFWNGTFREKFDFRVTESAGTVTGTLTPSNGHPDMTMIFSDGLGILDTDPGATIDITAYVGTDTAPVTAYVYIPVSTKVLTVDVAWPVGEHIRVATLVLQSAVTTGTSGALRNQNWNDEIQDTDTNQGHLAHLGQRLRAIEAEWNNGAEATLTVADTANSYVSIASGKVFQMHEQVYPALAMPAENMEVVNDPDGSYTPITSLNEITKTSDGSTIPNNRWISIVVWGVCNKSGETSHLMCNVPAGDYTSEANAQIDALGYSNYNIPKIFKGVGFLIARFTVQRKTSTIAYGGGDSYQDLRGFIPNSTAGSGAGGSGITTFLGLTDSPSTFVDQALKIPQVNVGETALEFTSSPTLSGLTMTGNINMALNSLDFGSGNSTITWSEANSKLHFSSNKVCFGECTPNVNALSFGGTTGDTYFNITNNSTGHGNGKGFVFGLDANDDVRIWQQGMKYMRFGTWGAEAANINHLGDWDFLGNSLTGADLLHLKTGAANTVIQSWHNVDGRPLTLTSPVENETSPWIFNTENSLCFCVDGKHVLLLTENREASFFYEVEQDDTPALRIYGWPSESPSRDIVSLGFDATERGRFNINGVEHYYFDGDLTTEDSFVAGGSGSFGGILQTDILLKILERAGPASNVAGLGQLWVKSDAPNTLWFTDDTNVDHQLGVGGGVDWEDAAADFKTSGTGEFDGNVGIGTNPFARKSLFVWQSALDTDGSYAGIHNVHTKSAGASDYLDDMFSFQNSWTINQVGGECGSVYGVHNTVTHTAGDVGAVGNERNLYGFFSKNDMNAGTVNGAVYGIRFELDQEAAHTITGDAFGMYLFADFDGTVDGTTTLLRLVDQTGVDYCIYQTGTSKNYFGGFVGIGKLAPNRHLEVSSGGSGTQVRLTGNSFAGMEFDSDNDGAAEAAFSTDSSGNFTFRAGGNSASNDKFRLMAAGGFFFKEQAAADTDQTTFGQLWVKNTNPVQLWFTDDLGNDTQIV